MAVKILEIHHTGVRVDGDATLLKATQDFYADVLGLHCDAGRPTIPARTRPGRTSPTPSRTSTRRAPSSTAWASPTG